MNKPFLIGLISLITTTASFANFEYCKNGLEMQRHDVGFFLSNTQVPILRGHRPLDRNKNLTEAQAKARIQASIQRTRPQLADITDDKLAALIAKASFTVGVDFQVLSSIVRKESVYCKLKHNTIGGDSGCMQFTSAAMNELKDQFSGNSKVRAPEVPGIMKAFVTKFFAGQPDREKKFYAWLGSSNDSMRIALRGNTIKDIDILSGALLLKFYLATKDGNYYNALVQYNGNNTINRKKKKAHKYLYAGDVQAYAQTISLDTSDCTEGVIQTNSMIDEGLCSFSDDENCFDAYNPELTTPLVTSSEII